MWPFCERGAEKCLGVFQGSKKKKNQPLAFNVGKGNVIKGVSLIQSILR